MQSASFACVLLIAVLPVARSIGALKPAANGVEQKVPWFCHDLDCPSFDLLNKTDGYETRKYQAGEVATA